MKTLVARIQRLEQHIALTDEERYRRVLELLEQPAGTPNRRQVIEILLKATDRYPATTGQDPAREYLEGVLAEELAHASADGCNEDVHAEEQTNRAARRSAANQSRANPGD